VSPYGRCHLTEGYKCSVCVWIVTQCPLMEGVPLLEITNVVFVCGPCLIVPLGRCHLTEGYKCSVCVWITTQCNLMRGVGGYKCSVCVWIMTQCPLMGGVPLLEVTNVVLVCGP